METTVIEDAAHDLVDRIRPRFKDAKGRLESLNARVTSLVNDHPAACLLGALALGYTIARVARRERS